MTSSADLSEKSPANDNDQRPLRRVGQVVALIPLTQLREEQLFRTELYNCYAADKEQHNQR